MPRVLFVTMISDMARPTGYRTRVLSEMEAVRGRGVETYLLALSPPQLVVRRRARQAFQRELARHGLTGRLVAHLPSFGTRLGRQLMLHVSSGLVRGAARKFGADVVHAHGPYAAGVALCSGRPVVFDAHGAAADEFALNGRLAGWPRRRYDWEVQLVRELEHRSWTAADVVVAVSNPLVDHLSGTYGQRTRGHVVRVPCAVTDTAFVEPARERVRRELDLGDRVVLVYVGSLAPYQLAPEMVELVKQTRALRSAVKLLAISQAEPAQWHCLARAAGLGSDGYTVVRAEGKRVAELTSAGDIALMLRQEALLNAVAFPTKLGEYLAAGVPVLTTAATRDPAELIQRKRLGFVAPDLAALTPAAVLAFLDEVYADRATWAERCRAAAASELSWERYAAVLADLYREISG